ncbi:HlyU family transcriptional regulator [Halomonas sp.]|uniref:HlyU family transcriptional regulator n=1 Tax=Halomonas sp. TaxID=1486246 RepID=UPI0025BA7D7F|nr:HlyU family transcriptional regulator [Halomonas sp.]
MFKKLLSGLLGGGDRRSDASAPANAPAAEPVEYKGYRIISEPADQNGQYRVSGWIRRDGTDGERQEHRFERSDMVSGREACDQLMVSKAQRFIDEVGEEMFRPR